MGPCAGAGALKIAADGFSCSTPNPNPKGKAVRPCFSSVSWIHVGNVRLGSESDIEWKTAPPMARFLLVPEKPSSSGVYGKKITAGQAGGHFLALAGTSCAKTATSEIWRPLRDSNP